MTSTRCWTTISLSFVLTRISTTCVPGWAAVTGILNVLVFARSEIGKFGPEGAVAGRMRESRRERADQHELAPQERFPDS